MRAPGGVKSRYFQSVVPLGNLTGDAPGATSEECRASRDHGLGGATQVAAPRLLVPVFVVPVGHATQVRSTEGVPVPSATYVPAAHTVIATHCASVALAVAALNLFAGQAVQMRSTVADGVFET